MTYKKVLSIGIFSCLLLLACSTLISCDDWFDVRPKSQVKEKDLFSTEAGFRDATLGVYTLMASTDAYGGNMTMGLLDVLAQQYSDVTNPYTTAISYSYTNATIESMIDNMWRQCYKAIVNCNYILRNIEENGGVMSAATRNIVKGEAMAMRAYLHFDMMRLYAPCYAAGSGQLAVPYVYEPTVNAQKRMTVSALCDQLVNDLQTARELLKPYDPICEAGYNENLIYKTDDYLKDDGFTLYRTSRMNYYAVTALLARIYLYKGDKSNALNCAQEVINSGKFDLINDALIAKDSEETRGNGTNNQYSFMQSVAKHEYISGLYVYNLKENISDQYYRDGQGGQLRISDMRKMSVFGASGIDYDIRAKRMFAVPSGSSNEYCIKYLTGTQIPLLKIGEMYLIAAEASGDISYLYTLLQKRGYPNPMDEGTNLTSLLQKEYQREFIGEGQLFYYYKRQNLSKIPFSQIDASDAVYVLPVPVDELEFGYSE
ncbi:MAG: RagB/SusD family nutrient uptake outer membrane protein [Prevotella sp.]|nr:RagB/SusD family nutrient uptake outer membrane protein [Prevotella sp.]MBP3828464.1 RagB/SusD family nutrient uptake outer membrane protein [Prevotella sp.]